MFRGMIEQCFERFLWGSRLVVIVAVLASLAVSFCMFYVATVDAFHLVGHTVGYASASASGSASHSDLRAATITRVVEVVDGYLVAAIMLIFSLGLYELFISRIDHCEQNPFASRLLLIRSIDDLKDRLSKMILVILIVKYFEHALGMHFQAPLDLLYLSVGIVLIAVALHLTHQKEADPHQKP